MAYLPFKGAEEMKLWCSVLCGSYMMPFEVSPELQDLQGWLLTWDPYQKPRRHRPHSTGQVVYLV